jgi:hypothetical protein
LRPSRNRPTRKYACAPEVLNVHGSPKAGLVCLSARDWIQDASGRANRATAAA